MIEVMNLQAMGNILFWFRPEQDESWKDTITEGYGFGWYEATDFEVDWSDNLPVLKYPNDPDMHVRAMVRDHDTGEELYMFDHAFFM